MRRRTAAALLMAGLALVVSGCAQTLTKIGSPVPTPTDPDPGSGVYNGDLTPVVIRLTGLGKSASLQMFRLLPVAMAAESDGEALIRITWYGSGPVWRDEQRVPYSIANGGGIQLQLPARYGYQIDAIAYDGIYLIGAGRADGVAVAAGSTTSVVVPMSPPGYELIWPRESRVVYSGEPVNRIELRSTNPAIQGGELFLGTVPWTQNIVDAKYFWDVQEAGGGWGTIYLSYSRTTTDDAWFPKVDADTPLYYQVRLSTCEDTKAGYDCYMWFSPDLAGQNPPHITLVPGPPPEDEL